MLIRNGRSMFQNPGRFAGALTRFEVGNAIKGGLRNRELSFNPIFSAYPNGGTFAILPGKRGSLSSYSNEIPSQSSFTLVPAKPMSFSASSELVGEASITKIVRMSVSASLAAFSGSASLSAAVSVTASSSQATEMQARLGGLFPMQVSATQDATMTSRMTALAFMEAASGGVDPLSPEGIVQGVVDSLNPQLESIQKNTDLIPVLL